MKKFTIAILAVVYLTLSSGVAMSIHYCMGDSTSGGVMHKNDKCGKCGMKSTTGCCKDEFKIVKLNDSHKLICNDIKIGAPISVIHNFYIISETDTFSSCFKSGYKNHSPPDIYGISLTILNSVFRI